MFRLLAVKTMSLLIVLIAVGGVVFFTLVKDKSDLYVDGAIEIGKTLVDVSELGRLSRVNSRTGVIKGLRIQEGREIQDDVGLKYGFDSGELPTLTYRIPRYQHRVFGDIFEFTFKGEGESKPVLDYGDEVVTWLIQRHLTLFQENQNRMRQTLVSIQSHRETAKKWCIQRGDEGTASSSEQNSLDFMRSLHTYSNWASSELRLRYYDALVLPRSSVPILRPALRS